MREGIDHWEAAGNATTGGNPQAELALSVKALEKAYAAGCRCPIALFIDARNLAQVNNDGTTVFVRFDESLKRTENKPDLIFVRISCANALAWRYARGGQYKEAIPYFEMALSLSSPDVEEDILKEARAGLQQAREKVAADEEQSRQLAALTLPPHPTKEQACAYVRGVLLLIGRKQGGSSPGQIAMLDKVARERLDLVYPEIAMLEKVGPENLDVLLEIWGTTGGLQSVRVDNFVKIAVDGLVRPENKAVLLKWLPLREDLVEIMQRKGWGQDMRPFLLARIAERSQYTCVEVLQAAAALRDPATNDDLVWHFENNQNGANIYDDIKNLPGIQLKDAVVRMWAASKSWTDWRAPRRYSMARAAMDYGVTEAMEFAVAKLGSPELGKWNNDQLRLAIRERTGQRGSDDDIRTWFQANKGKLVFDENRRMFVPTP
ncbi:MAG: hypothetical protein ABSA67_08005 [Candidatus Brocadiia bacterium]